MTEAETVVEQEQTSSIVDTIENLPEPEVEVESPFTDEELKTNNLNDLFNGKNEEQEPEKEAEPDPEPEKKPDEQLQVEEPGTEQVESKEESAREYSDHEKQLHGQSQRYKGQRDDAKAENLALQKRIDALLVGKQPTQEVDSEDENLGDEFVTGDQIESHIEKIISKRQQNMADQQDYNFKQADQIGIAVYDDFKEVVSDENVAVIASDPLKLQKLTSLTDPAKIARLSYEMCKNLTDDSVVVQPNIQKDSVGQKIKNMKDDPVVKTPVNSEPKIITEKQVEYLTAEIENASPERIDEIFQELADAGY